MSRRFGVRFIIFLLIFLSLGRSTAFSNEQFDQFIVQDRIIESNASTHGIPPAIKIDESTLTVLIRFVLKVHQTFVSMLGGTTFRLIDQLFASTGVRNRDHCKIVQNKLDQIKGPRADLIRDRLKVLNQIQTYSTPGQISENLLKNTQHLMLGEILKKDPKLRNAISEIIYTDGVLDCVMISILDTYRLIIYGIVFGVMFFGFSALWVRMKLALGWALSMGSAFFIPPAMFAINVFVFYLFYQPEIDPVIKILMKNLN